jgi:hypothetical protein
MNTNLNTNAFIIPETSSAKAHTPDIGNTDSPKIVSLHESESAPITPAIEPIDGKLLLDTLAATVSRFIVLPKWAAETLALWILHTYAFELRDVSTYIGIESPEKRCGKTTLLTLLGRLVNRPVAAANISSSAFFRVIQETRPTLLIDEADTFLQGNDELRGILNAGYNRETAFVMRVASERCVDISEDEPFQNCEEHSLNRGGSDRTTRLAKYSCWCPKVMAAIGHLPDTLADRCIVIRMQRKTSREECQRLRNLAPANLKEQSGRFILDHKDQIVSARPEIPPSLNDRAADIWEPLLVLADLAGGEWPQLARQAAVNLMSSNQESNLTSSLLLDIFLLFIEAKQDRLFSRTLVEGLNNLSHRSWREVRNGKEITELWLAQRLQPYNARPRTIRIGDMRAKGYFQEDLKDAFRRYISQSELDALIADASAANEPAEESKTEKSTPDNQIMSSPLTSS